MIELHVKVGCPGCRRLERRLAETAWAYQVITHDTELGRTPLAHAMVDSGEVIRGHDAVDRHIDEMDEFAKQWQSSQSDLCTCRDEAGDLI